jgi:TRAP-type mannitol/chloroaromatic compound transport system substrate-binding protein
VQVRPFPKDVGVAAWKATNELYAELSAKNTKWQKIYNSFAKYRDDQILWSRYAEGSYENLMMSMRSSGNKS